MPRLMFFKVGSGVWMSHLDLMRVFQRSFKRAGLKLTHTQGFNPRPSVSIALPLPVGMHSCCELLDFALEEPVACQEIMDRLNKVLPSGVGVLSCYEDGRKLKELATLRAQIVLQYDAGVPENAVETLTALFASPTLLVEKKGKNGVTQQDIIPMIKRVEITQKDANMLWMYAQVCCQNPSLNPLQLITAIETHCPALTPDYSRCLRRELFDTAGEIFK